MMGFKKLFLLSILIVSTSGQAFENLGYREVEQKILETLFKSPYDKRIRPMDFKTNDTSGTVVSINMFIRNFETIDDVNMQYSIQLTFRQQWNDNRLKFAHLNPPDKLKYLTLTESTNIWIPDIFVSNEKTASMHDMLVPNLFLRVYPNGDVLYSARLSMTLSCPMQLRTFPFDVQTCKMRMASYGYTTDDLIFKWKAEEPVQLTPHLDLPRFFVDQFTTEYCDSITNTGTYSCLLMKFSLRREYSYYNSQIFMPCSVVVLIGWLTFWICRYEPTARMVVLIATLLVMATLISGFNQTVPKVSYTKASDVFTSTCFLFIVAALLQYVLVHYLTSWESPKVIKKSEITPETHGLMGAGGEESPIGKNNRREQIVQGLRNFYQYWTWSSFKEQPIGQQIDMISRVLYPLAFFVFNLSYWHQYYNVVVDIEEPI